LSSPHRLGAFALVLATTSTLVAAYAVLSRPPASEPAVCSCDTEAVQARIATLERRVDAAERTAARNTVLRAAEAATEPRRTATSDGAPPQPVADDEAAGDDEAEPPEPARATPRFTEFQVAEPGITITQSEDGALTVRNTNPSLVGEILTVESVDEDGVTRPLSITVPPVE
jgi:hypothetical protein